MAAKNYTEILALVNAGNQMGLSNTIKRDYGIPLDFTSVQPSFDDAVIYAAENTKAYVGQPLSVGGKLYIINDVAAAEKHSVGGKEYDNYLVEVGSATEGDGVTIDLENKVLTLHGFDSALTGYLPRKAEDGSLEWVPVSAVVQGDGNKVTTITSTDGSVEITTTTDTDTSLVYDLKVTHPDIPEYAVVADARAEDATSTTYHLTKDGTNVDIGIVVPDAYNDAALAQRVSNIEADYLKAEDKYDDTALAARVTALEEEERYDETPLANRVSALETTVGNAESGLVKALADEVVRAKAAEGALQSAIDAIDFVDASELEAAVNAGVKSAKDYTDEQIDIIERAIADINHFTTKIVTSIDEVVSEGVLYLIKDESVTGADKYNEYLFVGGEAVLIGDTTTDLSNYYNKTEIDNKVSALEEAIRTAVAGEAEAREALAGRVEALENVDNATQAELDAYKTEVTQEIATAKSEAIADADGKLATKVSSEDFETFKGENTTAIATAKQEAIDAAAEAVENAGYAVAADVEATYATKQSVSDLETTVNETLADYAKTSDVETKLAKKIESAKISHSTEIIAEGVTVNGTELNIVVDAFTKEETIQKIDDKIEASTGGVSAADVQNSLNSYKSDNDTRVGAIETKNNEQDTAISAAQTQADKGVADAKTANDAIAALTNGAVATNTSDIGAIKTRLTTLETAKGDHETRIATAEGNITALVAEDVKINNKLGTIEGNITTLQNKDAELAGLITALQTNKADKDSVYTKSETDTQIEEAIAAIPAVDLTPYAKKEDVNTALASKANVGDAYTKDEADNKFMTETQVDNRLNALINAADPEGGKVITDIQNLVKYVDENASEIAALITATDANTDKLAGIDTTVTDYLADALAAIVQPKASAEITVSEDGTLGIGEVNVNKLVQSVGDTLIIDGGNA